jgi:hypothetical protein
MTYGKQRAKNTHYEKMMERYQKTPYNGTLREAGREEDQKIGGEVRLSK